MINQKEIEFEALMIFYNDGTTDTFKKNKLMFVGDSYMMKLETMNYLIIPKYAVKKLKVVLT